MLTISRIETPLLSFVGAIRNGDGGGLLGLAARAATNAAPGLSDAGFLSGMDPYQRQAHVEWVERLAANRQWVHRVLNLSLPSTSAELTTTVKAVFAVLSRFGPDAINLAQLSDNVNGVHLAVVLRSTADELKHTVAWQDALSLSRRALIREGIDPYDALMGMIPRD